MKALIISAIILFSIKNYFAGCSGPAIKIYPDNSYVNYFYAISELRDTLFVNPLDSFLLTVSGGNCYALSGATVYLNNERIYVHQDKALYRKFPSIPGTYCIFAQNIRLDPGYRKIVIVLDPHEVSEPIDSNTKTSISVAEQNGSSEFQLFPNPTGDLLNLTYETDRQGFIRIINPSGQTCLLTEMKTHTLQIDISALAPGVYHVEFFDQYATLRKKLVIH